MASEAYDSGRTRLFDQAQFLGSFDRPNVVDVLTTPKKDVYLTPYNVVYQDADSMFVYGGGFGDQGGKGAFVAKLDATTLERIWFKHLVFIPTELEHSAWDYPGVLGMLDDGMLYVIYGNELTKLDPKDGRRVGSLTLPTNGWPARDTAYNGFVALPDGTIIAKTVYRQIGCNAQGFDAFLKLEQFPQCDHPELVPNSIIVAIDSEQMTLKHPGITVEIPAFTVGRVTSTTYQNVDYVYVPGPHYVYRYIWNKQLNILHQDVSWGLQNQGPLGNQWGVKYNDELSGQTPASAIVVTNDWIMFTTNGAKISQPCNGPCQSPWLSVWAINQGDWSNNHFIQPFENMVGSKRYPLSFCPSAPTVDTASNRIFVFDAGPGKYAAVDLDPASGSLYTAWMVDQRTTEFTALIGQPGQRVLVGTDMPPGQTLGEHHNNFVVWRDAEDGEELARSPLPPVLSGTMVQPGYDGNMYYMGKSGEIKKLTARPAGRPPH
jgi:hypothetical protein